MKDNLVIVESPAKAKTIEKFLGNDYKVMSSYGHIRDLKKRGYGVDMETFMPEYEIPEDKVHVVEDLKKQAKNAKMVWLASDEDREGEAISWHLSEVLELQPENSRRIVFHEITKPAILEAIQNPRNIDLNLVDAQQARRVLDRLVGFKLSPLLWRKVKPSLSAGRVQSVAVRLIVEKEREVQQFVSEDSFRVTAVFRTSKGTEVKAELNTKFTKEDEAKAFLEQCKDATFEVKDILQKPQRRDPAPPFTTSTLQQEAAHKLGFTVAQTMTVAQHLYESGHITYMRTDSVNLSNLCLGASRHVIEESMGKEYAQTRKYHTRSKGAQEAHEAIRPTDMSKSKIEGSAQEKRLYNLIWKRTIACQMASAQLEKTQVQIGISDSDLLFVAQGEVVKFDGFLKVYNETGNLNQDDEESNGRLPKMQVGDQLAQDLITATQRSTVHPARYNEASLVKKLEELGIGRPSTYASTITTIQQREYVKKGDVAGEHKEYAQLNLHEGKITEKKLKLTVGAERGKLMPTDIGLVVNDFLMDGFAGIMDYNFTAHMEKNFDQIALGKKEWTKVISKFYKEFNPLVEASANTHQEHRVGERLLGTDPKSGEPVVVKIGRYGPMVQIGSKSSEKKPRFSQLAPNQSIETITFEEALELFKLPRELGEYNGKMVNVGSGRFGPYIVRDGVYISVPKDADPMTLTLKDAIILIHRKEMEDKERQLKTFPEEPQLEVLKGRYGAYIAYKGANYRLPKDLAERAKELTLKECLEVVEAQKNKPARRSTRRTARKTK